MSISDHLPIYIIIKKSRKAKQTTHIKGRSFKKYNNVGFQRYIQQDSKWKAFWLQYDVNIKWKILLEILLRAADKFCPLVAMKFNLDNEGWLTKEVIEAISEKNCLFKIEKHTPNNDKWALFKAQRRYARKLLLNTKEEFLKAEVEQNRDKPQTFWRKLNGIIGNTNINQTFTTIFNDTGNKIEKVEAAEFMNNYFTGIGENLNERNNTTWLPHTFFPNLSSHNFSLNVVTEDITQKYVKALDIKKPSGLSDLNNRLLRDAFTVLIGELTTLFNDSIIQEVFPQDWKMGTITPIPKSGNLMVKTNWRPITILNTFGFSTSSAIFELLIDIYDAKLKDMVTGCIFVDYQKAFDTINHNILFKKMSLYGFSKSCINWFKSFLSNRSQMTKCDSVHLSTPKSVTIGVPQGSTLGPLLFILYVNDLYHVKHLYNVGLKMYADDTVIYTCGKSTVEVQKTLPSCMDYVYNWCVINRLYMNMKKTKTRWIKNSKLENAESSDYEITINGSILSRVYSYLYLGVEIDDGLL